MQKKFIFSLIILVLPMFILSILFPINLILNSTCYATSHTQNTENTIENLPILMYHNILNNRKNKYIVSEVEFNNDMNFLKQNGYESILPRDLVSFVSGKKNLPKKPIMITFDDGHFNNSYYGKPILDKYGFKATINVIGKFSDNTTKSGDHSNPNYSHLTWEQITQINKEGVFEIGNHTWNMHNLKPRKGVARIFNESDIAYKNNLRTDFLTMQNKLKNDCNITCNTFAYPFGNITQTAASVLDELKIDVVFWASEGKNKIIKGDFSTIKKLKRFNRDGQINFQKLMSRIENKK